MFANNLRNYSALTEIATGNNRTLTCTVVQYSGPKNLTLNMTTASDVPSKPRKINDSSISVTITNASTADATQYICTACTGDTLCSYLNFLTYVGGEMRSRLAAAGHFNLGCHVAPMHKRSSFLPVNFDDMIFASLALVVK